MGILFNVLLAGLIMVLLLPKETARTLGDRDIQQIDNEIRLFFVGDIMLGRQVAVINKNILDYNFKYWDDIVARFPQADLTIGNLEGPITERAIQSKKTIQFRFDPKVARQLKQFGFDGFSLANNHTYDQGKLGAIETRTTLGKEDLFYFGDEYTEDKDVSVKIVKIKNIKIAFVGFNATEDGRGDCVRPQKAQSCVSMQRRVNIIKFLKPKANHIIVLLHWGVEYQELKFSKNQQALGHTLVDAGADAIIGTHPHVVQPLEIYKDKPIFYSLGNFIFDQYWSKPTQKGLVVGLTIAEDGTVSWSLIPITSIRSVPQLMEKDEEKIWLKHFHRASIL